MRLSLDSEGRVAGLDVEWRTSAASESLVAYVTAFCAHFRQHPFPLTAPPFAGVGRVLRGRTPADFHTLSLDPERRIVFLLDGVALTALLGLDGRQILRYIGHTEAEIARYLAQGMRFKLAVFAAIPVQRATWDALLDAVGAAYPDWRARVEEARPLLKVLSYTEVLARGDTATAVRRFLEQALNVNPLFTGTGCLHGTAQAEYIACNRPLAGLGETALIEFPVE